MTREEAIATAKAVALEQEWPWREPIFARKERPFIILGRPYWRLRSSADRRGGNVNVYIDCRTGKVLRKAFAPR